MLPTCPLPAPSWRGGVSPPCAAPACKEAEPSTHPWLGTHLGVPVLSQGARRLQSGRHPQPKAVEQVVGMGGCPGRGAWGAACGLVCVSHFSSGFGNRLQSSWSGGGQRRRANCETQTELPSPLGWRGGAPCQGLQPRPAVSHGVYGKGGPGPARGQAGGGLRLGDPSGRHSTHLSPESWPGAQATTGLGWAWRVLAAGWDRRGGVHLDLLLQESLVWGTPSPGPRER